MNILIVGAGPAGTMLACGLQNILKKPDITVIDNRSIIPPEGSLIAERKRRTYGLFISHDSIDAVQTVLKRFTKENNYTDSLNKTLSEWKGKIIPVPAIEDSLAKHATDLGAKVLRNSDYAPFLKAEHLDHLFDPVVTESPIENELKKYFQKADVILAADGAHSALRKRFMTGGDDEHREDVTNMQYFIEIKFQIHGLKRPSLRPKKAAITAASCQGIAFETLSRDGKPSEMRPATKHFFVGKRTYDHFADATDVAPWNLDRLVQESKTDPVIASLATKMKYYLQELLTAGATCVEPKIKRLPITVYKSTQAVAIHNNKPIVAVGDSLSGAVFARGVNKSWLEVASLMEAMHQYESQNISKPSEIPPVLKQYEEKAFAIYRNERFYAVLKAFGLRVLRFLLQITIKPILFIFYPLYKRIKSLFVKEVTFEELLKLNQEKIAKKRMGINSQINDPPNTLEIT